MRVHESVVLGARLGSRKDFDEIVRSYEGPLYGYAVSELGPGEAEDLVQEALLKAFLGLKGLREPGRFEAWLWSIARNEARSRRRARALGPDFAELDPETLPAAEAGPGSAGTGLPGREVELVELLSCLSAEQAAVVRLRFWTDLSVREIALVEGIPEKLAKSRLWEATELMRKRGGTGGTPRPGRTLPGSGRREGPVAMPPGLEEYVMDKVQLYRNAASVVVSMGLADQVGLAIAARKGERWSEDVFRAIGRTRGGSEFVKGFDARLGMRELAEILNCCDRATEKRLVEELEIDRRAR